jgi:GNAT superfamily N-acetyltransferase
MPLHDLPAGIEEMRAEAAGEGFRFVDKLIAEWRTGTNRFTRSGKVLVGAFEATELIAVCGLNRDPYTDHEGIGRLRHLYVRRLNRRSGVGTVLVRYLLERAEGVFHSVRLRTETQDAADFYVRLGFHPVHDEAATHARSPRQV